MINPRYQRLVVAGAITLLTASSQFGALAGPPSLLLDFTGGNRQYLRLKHHGWVSVYPRFAHAGDWAGFLG
jgi:hypothetical protein